VKLIGYGLFSLVFHPPCIFPDPSLYPVAAGRIKENPAGFVGLITTQEHYQSTIRKASELLNQLRARDPLLANQTVTPLALRENQDFLVLQNGEIQKLVDQYHAVRKRVEYDESWKGQVLVEMIYPYAGRPLEKFCKNPKNAPSWIDFFKCVVEVGRFIIALHENGYVHGDLSPNNLLYNKGTDEKSGRFTIVDWNMLAKAEDFLQHRKGRQRVGCWSPEHFSLTTTRVEHLEEEGHWLIYADEMQKYIERLLQFTGSHPARAAVKKYFEPYTRKQKHPIFQKMYKDLKILARDHPSAIGKYHDLRYLMDTIAKSVSCVFPDRNAAQQKQYNLFISLYLIQNLPDRRIYLENPDLLANRLSFILQACQKAEQEIVPIDKDLTAPVEAEHALLNLLR
jgi:hypothetical protein